MPQAQADVLDKVIRDEPPALVRLITKKVSQQVHVAWLDPQFARHLSFLEQQLKDACAYNLTTEAYLCGLRLTGADILMSFPLEIAATKKVLTQEKFPFLHTYLRRMQNRDAWKRAQERAQKELRNLQMIPL